MKLSSQMNKAFQNNNKKRENESEGGQFRY